MKMNAVRFYSPGNICYEEVDIPQINEYEVLVRIKVALTCTTDLKTYKRGHPVLIKNIPGIFGHEFSGIIEKVGSNVKDFKPGMRVVAANSAPCDKCFYCEKGLTTLCENLELLNGAYAQFIKIPQNIVEKNLLIIPESVSFKHAAMVEPLACTIHGIEKANINKGDYVGIVGGGPISLMLIRLAKLKGAYVIVVGRNDYKLSIAKLMGADEIVNINKIKDPVKTVKDLTPGKQGVDIGIEAVGIPQVWEKSIEVTRKGGLVVLFGGCELGTTIKLDTYTLHYHEKRLMGVFHHTPKYIKEALNLIRQNLIDPDIIITHELPLKELKRAFEMMENRESLKVAIYPD